MEISTSKKCATPPSPLHDPAEVLDLCVTADRMAKSVGHRFVVSRERLLNFMGLYQAAELPLPLDVFARLNDAGVIVR
jgi:hypothetical protein